jgi:hypothetical protein
MTGELQDYIWSGNKRGRSLNSRGRTSRLKDGVASARQ